MPIREQEQALQLVRNVAHDTDPPDPGALLASAPGAESSEQDLIERARAGDVDAFEGLIRGHASRVLSFLTRWLGNRAAAEDVFQEAAIRAFMSLHRLRPGAAFRPWFFRIAINRAKTHAEARGRRAESEHAWSSAPQRRVAESVSVSDPLDTRQVLEQALGLMSEDDRKLLLLRFAEELTVAEIGGVLRLPEFVVKMRIFRARKRFREAVRG